ncbi:secreted protein Hcp [Pseudomonas aeruginosa PA38182]|nr:secreted protein Hcp [Pseudomonas aeruginosa PA38182]
MVQGFNHEVIIPRDPQSGQPTGQRVHKPVVITKVFDKASPLLLAALTSGERLTKVEIQWYRTSAAGTQEHYYTTVLEDAIIVDIKDYMHNCQDPGNAHFTHLEDVHFTYRKITWTHEVSGTSGPGRAIRPGLHRRRQGQLPRIPGSRAGAGAPGCWCFSTTCCGAAGCSKRSRRVRIPAALEPRLQVAPGAFRSAPPTSPGSRTAPGQASDRPREPVAR